MIRVSDEARPAEKASPDDVMTATTSHTHLGGRVYLNGAAS